MLEAKSAIEKTLKIDAIRDGKGSTFTFYKYDVQNLIKEIDNFPESEQKDTAVITAPTITNSLVIKNLKESKEPTATTDTPLTLGARYDRLRQTTPALENMELAVAINASTMYYLPHFKGQDVDDFFLNLWVLAQDKINRKPLDENVLKKLEGAKAEVIKKVNEFIKENSTFQVILILMQQLGITEEAVLNNKDLASDLGRLYSARYNLDSKQEKEFKNKITRKFNKVSGQYK